jgi:integrase
MPRHAKSGLKGLSKTHSAGCGNRTTPHRCDCAWRFRGVGVNIPIARWAKHPVDPRSKPEAEAVITRINAAIAAHRFDPAGERPATDGPGTTLATFIKGDYQAHRDEFHLTDTGAPDMLNVIAAGPLGALTLTQLAGSSKAIGDWLTANKKARQWKPVTRNRYRTLLHTICDRAVHTETDGVKLMDRNPVDSVKDLPVVKARKQREVRLDEGLEDALLAACALLNRPTTRPNRTQLTMEKATEIRARVEAGESQLALATAFGMAPSTINSVVQWRTFNPARYPMGTKGDEMRRRLICALDTGARAGEMLAIQVKHVQWARPRQQTLDDGTRFPMYEIVLPAELTKGGKTTGETQSLIVGTLRLSRELDRRRVALKNNPEAYLFGTEAGKPQKSFKKLWHELFTLAGLDYGRDKGLVWHTTRHEFISRTWEDTKDPGVTMKAARHGSFTTTSGYTHVRDERLWAAAAGRNRQR